MVPLAPPLIEAVGLARTARSGAALLQDVNLSISPGERWAIVGDSGAGKTLLMRSLALLDPSAGRLLWQGEPIGHHDVPAYRARVIYLAQSAAVVDGTVEDNLRLPYTLHRHLSDTFDRDAAIGMLQSLRKNDSFLQRRASELSGGEKQIVALVRALQLRPQVLLLDEATSALDPESELAAERLVQHWLDEEFDHRAAVWVSHDRAQQSRVADRTFRLENGRPVDPPATDQPS